MSTEPATVSSIAEPARVFVGWDAPVLPRVAAWLHQRPAAELARSIVVVPGRRSGRLLLSHLVAIHDGRGAPRAEAGFTPPRIVTPGALPELFYQPARPLATRRERVLAWGAALENAPAGSWPGMGSAGETSARLAFARDLVRCQDELGEEGLRLVDLPDRAMMVAGITAEAERWRELGALEVEQLARLEACGLADPTAARLEALAGAVLDASAAERPMVVLCCLATVRGLERALLGRFAATVTALIAAPEREAAAFDAWGAVLVSAWAQRQVTLSRGSLRVVDRPRDQARAVAELAVQWRDERAIAAPPGGERPGITIGLGDPALARVVGEALADCGFGVHDALGRRLASTRPWRLLQFAARFATTGATADLAELLRQPDLEQRVWGALVAAADAAPPAATRELQEAIDRRDWLTVLDLYSTETALGAIDGALPGDRAGAALVAAAHRASCATLGTGGTLRPLGEWTARLRAFLLEVYGDGDRPLAGDGSGVELRRALERLGEELDAQAAAASAYGGGPRVTLGDAVDLLLTEVSAEPLAAPSAAASIEMLGWLELALDDAPRLLVAGLDEGVAAAALRGGLLQPALRRSLGVVDADSLHARDLYFLELLAESRDATFVCGRRGDRGEPLAPRRILLAGATTELVDTVLAFWADPGDEPDGGSAVDEPGKPASARRGGFAPIRPARDAPLPTRLPATAFRDYLACPYRFYLRHVLGLRPVRDLPRELLPGEFGRLLHAVLGRLARSAVATSTDAQAIAHALDQLLDEEVARRSGSAPRVAVRLQLEQLRRRLRSFAEWQALQARAGWAMVAEHAEARLEATLDVDGAPFVVTGRVDRVDRHPTAGFRLLDYKSAEQSRSPEQSHRGGGGRRGARRWIDLQLPLYELMLRQRGLEGPLALGFVNLGHRLTADPLALAEWSAADLADALAAAQDVVRAIRARRFWPPGDPPSYDDGLEGLAGDAFPDRERWVALAGAELGAAVEDR
jgi:hypothetical protein